METTHKVIFNDSRDMRYIPNDSIDLIVTSPPYPMIEMWDDLFIAQNPKIKEVLSSQNGILAFNLMHEELNKVWSECYRVLKKGGYACINIGDATRTLGGEFQLYPSHAKILSFCSDIGFHSLPGIIWKKQTNSPAKFMGSGMLPTGAYVTLEYEHILLLRKSGKRKFKTEELYTDKRITDELETLEESIELANTEIRHLIGHFRSPQEIDNIETEILKLVENFKEENDNIKIFFKNKIPIIKSNKNDQLHIKRIAQEALTNVKKHSQAKIVRVLLMSYETGKYSLIIEDDGIGIAKSCFIGHDDQDTGEHVGLAIMRDRAQQIGGHIAIESEPGEGVRVILSFNEKEG